MKNPQLTSDEYNRYSRHFNLKDIGLEGQKRLKAAKVLCVGAGGLGSPALLYLCAAGIGQLGIVDFDVVEISNLQRQVLFDSDNLHQSKVAAAKKRLNALNPYVQIDTYHEKLNGENALKIFEPYDIIIDATDNFTARYLVNDVCFHLYKPYVFASIFQFEGQCTVFDRNKGSSCYRCLFPEKPLPNLIPNCAEAGVLGVLPGMMGCIQATEVIKYILGLGEPLLDKLLIFDALKMQFNKLNIQSNPDCVLCNHKIPFEKLMECNSNNPDEITPRELHEMIKINKDIQLLDVREAHEYAICHLNATLIPIAELPLQLSQLNTKNQIIIYCKSGKRGEAATQFLKEAGFKNVKNLKGGILGWINEIDSSLQRY